MRSLLLSFLTLFLVCCTGVEIGKMSKEEYCQKTWKFDLECALNHTLSDEEVQKISELAEKLKGENCKQTAWNALKWVEENLKYDYYKASLPPPTIITKGREVTVLNPERIYQTPEETMMLRKGICGDFAILTTAILIRNGCNAYVLFVDFIDYEIDHLASAVLLDKIYVLDQKLPPMDLGSYYNKWLREGKRIGGIVIYERDKKLMSFNESEIMAQNYKFTKRDLEELKNLLIEKLKRELAYGEFYYREKLIITMFFDGLADYYTPMFSEEIAEMIKERLLEKIEKKWKGFSLELEVSWPDIVLKLSLTN